MKTKYIYKSNQIMKFSKKKIKIIKWIKIISRFCQGIVHVSNTTPFQKKRAMESRLGQWKKYDFWVNSYFSLSSLKCQIFLLFLFWTCTLYFKGENKCTKPDPSVHNIPPSHWPPKDTPIIPISSSANEVHIVLIIRMEKRTAPFCNFISFKVNYKMTSFKISNLLTFSVYFWNIHVAQTVKL